MPLPRQFPDLSFADTDCVWFVSSVREDETLAVGRQVQRSDILPVTSTSGRKWFSSDIVCPAETSPC